MAEDFSLSADLMASAAEDAANVMRALSNPSRLLLLCQLVEGEKSVGELERALGMSQAYVSQQLARLRAEALVRATREGRVMRYRLADPRVTPVLQAIYDQYCPQP
jgi:ArsR family transcriptional regulator